MERTKPIAVLSSNRCKTVVWIQQTYGADFKPTRSGALVNSGPTMFVIIQNWEDALGWEFSDMLIAPNYVGLEREVRSRIK